MITVTPMKLEHVPGYREGLGQVGRERRLVIDIDEDVWDLVQAVNVKGIFLCSQAVAPVGDRGSGWQDHQHLVPGRPALGGTLRRLLRLEIRGPWTLHGQTCRL